MTELLTLIFYFYTFAVNTVFYRLHLRNGAQISYEDNLCLGFMNTKCRDS